MGQKKLQRFAEIKTFPNVLEYPAGMKGNWKTHFRNNNEIVLELACGKGEYAVGLAELESSRNYIGIDIKGNRIWRGAKTALEKNLPHVAFIRSHIDKITDYFEQGEVSEIWITFPDPQLRISRSKKRLTHPRFLRLYQHILKKGGIVHLKTDSPVLYRFTKQVIALYGLSLIKDIDDIHSLQELPPELAIQTHYEKLDIAQSQRVHYLQFLLDGELPVSKEEQLKQITLEQESNGG